MLNKSILMGRLVRDPEHRQTQSGTVVASFTLAVGRDYPNQNGNYQTDFIDCVAWGKLGEFVCKWFTKGMLAVVVGRIQSRNWEDKNGNKRTSIEVNCEEINFGETKAARERSGSTASAQPQQSFTPPTSADFAELPDDEYDVPF